MHTKQYCIQKGRGRKKKLQDPKLGLSGPEKGSSIAFARPKAIDAGGANSNHATGFNHENLSLR
jgi:hypothetical protein